MLSGRYPSDEFAELKPRIVWDRVDRHAPEPQRRARGGGHVAAARSRIAACMASSCRDGDGKAAPRRRARRGDGLRIARRRGFPARRQLLADRGDSRTTGSSSRPRPASRGRCRSGTAISSAARRARPRHRRVRARAGRCRRPLRRAGSATSIGSTSCAAQQPAPYLAEQREATGASNRPDARPRTLPRRARRLAGLPPHAVRRPRPRPLGDGDRGAPGRAWPRRPDDLDR